MDIIDRGTGPALVVVPGIQGRWEWIRPAIDELAESFRVITFSLLDEPSHHHRRTTAGIDDYARQIEESLDDRGIDRATICGISFGGRIALRFAARYPDRTAGLVLASTPGPHWHLRPSHEIYARWPRLFAPFFFASTPARLRAEIKAAIPDWWGRWRFRVQQAALLLQAPLSPSRMAARARLIATSDVVSDCHVVSRPALIVCGEAGLDHVVTVGGTLEYARLIRGSEVHTLEHTGHLGCLTRPRAFAAVIRDFVCRERSSTDAA